MKHAYDDETVAAYVDDELDATGRAAFETALAGDPELARRVERQRELRRRLVDAFAGVLDEPVPDRLLAAARTPAAEATPHAGAGPRTRRTRGVPAPMLWFATAASLAIGVGIGLRLGGDASIVADASGLVARGALDAALTTRLASEPPASGRSIDVGLSFVARDGHYCRTFSMREPGGSRAGLACREPDGAWRLQALEVVAVSADAGDTLRPASSAALPASVLAAVEARLGEAPLDAEGERAARDAGWRVRR